MSPSAAELARAFFERVWNQRREDELPKFAHADGISHQSIGEFTSIAAFRDHVYRPFLDAFPDLNIEIEDILAEGDRAVVRWRSTGTHQGDGLGIPATGKSVIFRGVTWFAFRDGKIIEAWDNWDQHDLFRRLSEPNPD